jgi:uncharacterized SAM-binding protein YcdF (DUF218 family)
MLSVKQSAQLFNILIRFFARQDLNNLTRQDLSGKYSIQQADLIVLLGNSSIFVAESAAKALQDGLGKQIMICGGRGHSTIYLYNNILRNSRYNKIKTDQRAESEIFGEILICYFRIPSEKILIESKSTNCGQNAEECFRLLKKENLQPRHILLMQDPILQLRTEASFRKVFKDEKTSFISYASFIPLLTEEKGIFSFRDQVSNDFCDMDRFLSLVMGEIPRLRNDENGYGPKGKNFIASVEVPDEVMNAFELLKEDYANYIR